MFVDTKKTVFINIFFYFITYIYFSIRRDANDKILGRSEGGKKTLELRRKMQSLKHQLINKI